MVDFAGQQLEPGLEQELELERESESLKVGVVHAESDYNPTFEDLFQQSPYLSLLRSLAPVSSRHLVSLVTVPVCRGQVEEQKDT